MNLKHLLSADSARPYLLDGHFGLEKESQRVTADGKLAATAHPAAFGSRDFHPYIQTDFAETQLEAITPVAGSEEAALRFLSAVTTVMTRSLPEDERIWPLSMPPALPDDANAIQLAALSSPSERAYRQGLADKYGKRKQMVSGVHYNFEFSDGLLRQLWRLSASAQDFDSFKNACYMKVARGYIRYQWLVTYLTGASPRAARGYFSMGETVPVAPSRSLRNSEHGYRNLPPLPVRFDSLDSYYADLADHVQAGHLSQMKEYYAPVRPRGGHSLEALPDTGIHYLELRNLDLDPFEPLGIGLATCQFLHLLCLFLLYRDETGDYRVGNAMNDAVALESPTARTAYFDEGLALFDELSVFVKAAQLPVKFDNLVGDFASRLTDPSKTPAARIEALYQPDKNFALALADAHYRAAFVKPYQLPGFTALELSTQALIYDAIQKGLDVTLLDARDNFVELRRGIHHELIKNGNMTARDSLVSYALMENKTVTKKLLSRAGFRVPGGAEFSDERNAVAAFARFSQQPIVVKPKSTNYGKGITIFKTPASEAQYSEAVALAFAEDHDILVEAFAAGTEYRFFVVDGQTTAVLRRDAASVTGDGHHTIAQLVALKNQDPLRGAPYEAPLERIALGDIERLTLATQGLTPDDIPENARRVQLRENSNISTGGDSIDMTDAVDPAYKRIACQAATALGVSIAGLDLMIPDITRPDGPYTIIEANFNPMMSMHLYPAQGQPRRVTLDILRFLFPEIF